LNQATPPARAARQASVEARRKEGSAARSRALASSFSPGLLQIIRRGQRRTSRLRSTLRVDHTIPVRLRSVRLTLAGKRGGGIGRLRPRPDRGMDPHFVRSAPSPRKSFPRRRFGRGRRDTAGCICHSNLNHDSGTSGSWPQMACSLNRRGSCSSAESICDLRLLACVHALMQVISKSDPYSRLADDWQSLPSSIRPISRRNVQDAHGKMPSCISGGRVADMHRQQSTWAVDTHSSRPSS